MVPSGCLTSKKNHPSGRKTVMKKQQNENNLSGSSLFLAGLSIVGASGYRFSYSFGASISSDECRLVWLSKMST